MDASRGVDAEGQGRPFTYIRSDIEDSFTLGQVPLHEAELAIRFHITVVVTVVKVNVSLGQAVNQGAMGWNERQ
jgi:hypothetical protein